LFDSTTVGSLRRQTGNIVAQRSCETKLLNFVAFLTCALEVELAKLP